MNIFHLTTTDYDGEASYAIVQGSTFNYVTFWHPDNIATWTPRGQIRTNYVQQGGLIIASFSFDPLVYEQQTINNITAFRTKIRPILTASQTEALQFDLPLRSSSGDRAIPGRNVWVYDIELQHPSNGTVIRIAKGFVEVDLEVTR